MVVKSNLVNDATNAIAQANFVTSKTILCAMEPIEDSDGRRLMNVGHSITVVPRHRKRHSTGEVYAASALSNTTTRGDAGSSSRDNASTR